MKTKNLTLTEVQAVLDKSEISDFFCPIYSTELEKTANGFPIFQLQPIKLVVKNNYGVVGSQLRALVVSFAYIGIEVSIAAPQLVLGKREILKTTFYLWRL